MKRIHVIPMILAVLLLGPIAMWADAPTPQPGDSRPADRDAIRAHIDTIFRAYMSKDRAAVRATHSRDWRGFLSASQTTIRGIDAYMDYAEQSLGGPARIVDYRMVEFDVLFYGDLAVVPYVAEMQIELAGGRFPASIRVLDIYGRIDGEWIQVASHTASHPDTEAARRQYPAPLPPRVRQEILDAREAAWRAWFENDEERLARFLPDDAVGIGAEDAQFAGRDEALASAKEFAAAGLELVRLAFPKTEIRLYRDIAVLYSTYESEVKGPQGSRTVSGRASEVFIKREGTWVNTGWHLDHGL